MRIGGWLASSDVRQIRGIVVGGSATRADVNSSLRGGIEIHGCWERGRLANGMLEGG